MVIIIISILAAIALPMYLSQRQKAWDANIKSDLYNAAVAQATYYLDTEAYTGSTDDLAARGYNRSEDITLIIPTSGNSYCMQASHAGDEDRIWFVESGAGGPHAELGNCP